MTAIAPSPTVGPLLRDWRQRRRRSQLDLASDAAVSTRHLSFVETGRAKPSRELLLHLAEHLEVPLRDRNTLLLAAGYSPTFRRSDLDSEEMAPVREALDKVLAGHEPFPAIVVDRKWDVVSANAAALGLLTEGVDTALLEAPVNALRISLHPAGLAPRIANLAEWAEHLTARLDRQIAASADSDLIDLVTELRGYPGVDPESPAPDSPVHEPAASLFVPLLLRSGDHLLRLFSTVATFGTALDITVAELSIEAFFPADAPTAAVLRAR